MFLKQFTDLHDTSCTHMTLEDIQASYTWILIVSNSEVTDTQMRDICDPAAIQSLKWCTVMEFG